MTDKKAKPTQKMKMSLGGYVLTYFVIVFSISTLMGITAGILKGIGVGNPYTFLFIKLGLWMGALLVAYRFLKKRFNKQYGLEILYKITVVYLGVGVIFLFTIHNGSPMLERAQQNIVVAFVMVCLTFGMSRMSKSNLSRSDKDDC